MTDERIAEVLGFGEYTTESTKATLTAVARAIEAEVRKDDEALIEQMQDALEEILDLVDLLSPLEGDTTRKVRKAITAASARLEEKT